jgi:hypothetical protein
MSDIKSINLIIEKLFSKNIDEVLFAINKIRHSGNPAILPHVIELLNSEKNIEITSAIIELLNDLKIQAGTLEIIKAIENNKYKSIQKILLVSCWHSGLNYTEHLNFFVDLFVSGNFEIAFEAFTIIENMEGGVNQEIIEPLIERLKSGVSNLTKEKADLLAELVQVLENIKQ